MNYFDTAHRNMITNQLMPLTIIDEGILEAMTSIKRHSFLPDSLSKIAYADHHLKLTGNRWLLSSVLFAKMLVAAELTKEDRVLDLHALNGYYSAVNAQLAEYVVAVEEDEDYASDAHNALIKHHVDNVIVVSDISAASQADNVPYDVIFIYKAIDKLDESLLEILSDNGCIIALIKNTKILSPAHDIASAHLVKITKQADSFVTQIISEETAPIQ